MAANGKNAFGKCVSKMARMKNDAGRTAAVERIGDSADRCTERSASNRGKGHGNGKGHAKGKSKHFAKSLSLPEAVGLVSRRSAGARPKPCPRDGEGGI